MKSSTIHVVGDSISMHYGPYLDICISPYHRYSRIGKLIKPEGVNGGDSSQVLAYLKRCKTEKIHWDLLVLNCGLHDIRFYANGKNQTSIEKYQSNLENIFNLASQLAAQIAWVRTTPVIDELHNPLNDDYKRYNADVEKYNRVADQIVAGRKIYAIDLYTFCQCLGEEETYCDHVHFTKETRNLQGSFIAGQLIAFLAMQNGNIQN